jgi:AcrR family transcriptional regulator
MNLNIFGFMSVQRAKTQTRGNERRKTLTEACRHLLAHRHVGQFGLAEVAAEAGVPKTSVYHFFPRIEDLLAAVAVEVADELLEWLGLPLPGPFAAWSDVVRGCVVHGRAFYAANPAALEIQLAPFTPADIKNRDRENDVSVGLSLRAAIERHFRVPDLPDLDGAFFRAIEIADLMFMLSVREHGGLTDFYTQEASRAAIAYLALYLPPVLAPVQATP